jgi:hypothetical protein
MKENGAAGGQNVVRRAQYRDSVAAAWGRDRRSGDGGRHNICSPYVTALPTNGGVSALGEERGAGGGGADMTEVA